MLKYELETCKNLQQDLKELGCEMELDAIKRFWLDYSDHCFAGWLGYETGEFYVLEHAIDVCTSDIIK